MLTSSPPTSAPGTDKTGMDFRRILPEIRCQSCLSPGSEPTPRGGFSSPVCPKTVCPAPASVTLFAPLISYDYAVFPDSPPVCGSSVPGGPDTHKTSGASHSHRALHTRPPTPPPPRPPPPPPPP